jgi:hypothetical protein
MTHAINSALSGRSVRSHLRSLGAFTGASILALSVVVVPPDRDSARTEIRAVQLTASAWAGTEFMQVLENLVNQRVQAVIPAAKLLVAGGTVYSGDTATKSTAEVSSLKVDPATEPRTTAAATLAATPGVSSVPFPLNAVLGFVALFILFAPLIVGVILLCPICAVINELSYIIPGVSPVGALAASPVSAQVAEATAFAPSTTTGDPIEAALADVGEKRARKDSVAAVAAAQKPARTATAPKKKDVTQTADATEPTSGKASEPSSDASASKPGKGAVHPNTRTVAAAEGSAATARTASAPAHSNGKASRSSAGDSPDSDSDGS